MIRDDDHPLAVPDLGGLAEFAFEHADGARSADIMRHEHVSLHPDIIARLNAGLARRARQYFLGQRHKEEYPNAGRRQLQYGIRRYGKSKSLSVNQGIN